MITLTVIFMLCLAAVAARSKRVRQKRSSVKQSVKINALLHNVEVYDGTPKGQKRLEDII